MHHELKGRQLYIADLARRLHEMESGTVPMQPLVYRVVSRQLRQALAGLPEPVVRAEAAHWPPFVLPLVDDMRETRHFEQHGCLHGALAWHCRALSDSLLARLRRPR